MTQHSDINVNGSTIAGRDEILQFVSFKLGEEEYGVDIQKVQEINRMIQVTAVPNAETHVEGVINLRGKVVPIVNLRVRLGMERRERDKNTRIIVTELKGMVIGFVVDAVNEVLRIPRSVTEPPPSAVVSKGGSYVTGVGKLSDRLLTLLDLEELLLN